MYTFDRQLFKGGFLYFGFVRLVLSADYVFWVNICIIRDHQYIFQIFQVNNNGAQILLPPIFTGPESFLTTISDSYI